MKDYSWIAERNAGILAHISSLASKTGIGNFGEGALKFLEFLSECKMKYWQICPLNPTGFGDSPYQSFSAFAGNTYFIDFEELFNAGLLDESDRQQLLALPSNYCDFGKIYQTLPALLKKATSNKDIEKKLNYKISFKKFCDANSFWLENYAQFTALKENFNGKIWSDWDDEFKFKKFKKLDAKTEETILSVKYAQWIFFSQYANLKAKAAELGIEIIGDMPIFLSYDSADVWASPELFDLDKNLKPKNVAGVGPDYFSPKGQLWGNPLYAWKKEKKACYAFWEKRLAEAFKMYDVLRLDHFRGFADFWEIPADSKDASSGSWQLGPGLDFFERMRKIFPTQKFIAEDLGLLSDVAVKLCKDINIPTMAVLQFAFGGDASNPYLPHNINPNMICYTGTHDNDTTLSWYAKSPEKTKDHFRRYLATAAESANWSMTLAAFTSVAKIAIIPMQDILSLGESARMNTPGEAAGNWQWRMTFNQLEDAKNNTANYLYSLCELSGRAHKISKK